MNREATVSDCIQRLILVGNVAAQMFMGDHKFKMQRYSDRWEWGVTLGDEFGRWDMITLHYQSSVREQVEMMGGEVC